MDGIGGAMQGVGGAIASAFRDLMQSVFGALQSFVFTIERFFMSVYSYIPRNYVIGGLTILALGILLMIFVGRPRR
jgi:hypothetical protein